MLIMCEGGQYCGRQLEDMRGQRGLPDAAARGRDGVLRRQGGWLAGQWSRGKIHQLVEA